MDKYYVPSAEEFYIGFEYEILTPNPQNDLGLKEEGVYIKVKFPDPFVGYRIDKIKNVRVKYLDREDLESFEWKYQASAEWEGDLFWMKGVYGVCDIMYNYKTHKMIVCILEDFKSFAGGDVSTTIFCGTIKNKSELSRIIKMLNINQ